MSGQVFEEVMAASIDLLSGIVAGLQGKVAEVPAKGMERGDFDVLDIPILCIYIYIFICSLSLSRLKIIEVFKHKQ